jgi:hypothetical protein
VTTLQPFQLKSNAMAKGSGNTPLAVDVSRPPTDFSNGAHYRLPWAVSRDLQTVAMSGKELYFRVTDSLLKDVAHGGGVQTGFDFACSMFDGSAVPYVIKSYDGAAGTLMGVFKPFALAGSTAATRGFLYFGNPAWTVSKEEPDLTFPNATSVLFLPSGVDKSGAKLNFDANLPTSDKVIVNPGALVDGSQVAGNDIERALVGDCGAFLISFLCQSIPNSVDNSPLTFGSGTGTTVIYLRHCFATPNGPHPTTDITNCWRVGFATGGKETDYETAQDTADQTLQHIVFRRVIGSRPELYINGVLSPFSFTFEDTGVLSSRLDFTNQKIIIGRGSVSNSRWWNGYIDCFKFFKDDAKTADWALAEYSNLMDIDGGVIFGSPETVATSSVWGETIKIQADQLTSVDFKADKYSATVGGTIALRASAPFDNPTNGKFTDQGANTVRYTNTKAVDPDNDGAVHLTNGVGNVIIPVRAKIIVTGPPPVDGYYKDPWDNIKFAGMTAVPVTGGRSDFLSKLATVKSTSGWTRTRYLRIDSAISGADIAVDAGTTPTQTDPLIIMATGAGTDTGWGGRSLITAKLNLNSKYTWLYGLNLDWASSGDHHDGNAQVMFRNDWQFVTACRMIGQQMTNADAHDVVTANLHLNYNRCELRPGVPGLNDYRVFFLFTEQGAGAAFKVAHPVTVARNYFIDGPGATDNSVDCIHVGEGSDPDQGHSLPDVRFEYNYASANFKRGIYMKLGCYIRWNDFEPLSFAGVPSDSADCIFGFRGPTSAGGLCAYNRLRRGAQFMCHGPDNVFVSNIIVAGNGHYRCSALLGGTGKDTPAANNCQFIGNTGPLWLPWYVGNADTPKGNLGTSGTFLIAGHTGAIREQAASGGDGPIISFNAAGTPTGSHPWLTNSGVHKQDAIPPGYTLATPPVLNTTVCGPGAVGKTWGT